MRLVTYESNEKWRAGILIEDKVVDASAVALTLDIGGNEISNRTILPWALERQLEFEKAAQALVNSKHAGVHRLEDVCLGPPIPDPDKILCLGLNYRSHAEEAGLAVPKVPILFGKYRNT